jgi:anti-anti-sigma factor
LSEGVAEGRPAAEPRRQTVEMQIIEDDGLVRVVLNGRLDTAGVSRIESQFFAGIVPRGRPTVVDMGEVPFLASLGIRMLISTARSLSTKGARLAMYNPTPGVLEVIEMTSLNEIVPTTESEAEAIALVRA